MFLSTLVTLGSSLFCAGAGACCREPDVKSRNSGSNSGGALSRIASQTRLISGLSTKQPWTRTFVVRETSEHSTNISPLPRRFSAPPSPIMQVESW